jgi:hypothetical protein
MSRADLNELLPVLFDFAQLMLSKEGEFLPFAASMTPDGKIQSVGGYTGDEHPPSQELIDLLTMAFQRDAAAGKLRATGICMDVRTIAPGETQKTDAICARLEHSDGEAVEVFLPYRKTFLGKIKYGTIFATAGAPVIFPAVRSTDKEPQAPAV